MMEFDGDDKSTVWLRVPDDATFEKLVDLTELPECTLELAETREITDRYLDTKELNLLGQGSSLCLATIGPHHFLIWDEQQHPGTLLASRREQVERLTTEAFAEQSAGGRQHPIYDAVSERILGELRPTLVRRATLQSRLFKVGETRFELGLEAIVYERSGRSVAEQLVSLELIQGTYDVLEAIGAFLREEYQLEPVSEAPFPRGMKLTE